MFIRYGPPPGKTGQGGGISPCGGAAQLPRCVEREMLNIDAKYLQHRFWRFVHNVVAHPLMEVLPKSIGDRLHDETAKRMNIKPWSEL